PSVCPQQSMQGRSAERGAARCRRVSRLSVESAPRHPQTVEPVLDLLQGARFEGIDRTVPVVAVENSDLQPDATPVSGLAAAEIKGGRGASHLVTTPIVRIRDDQRGDFSKHSVDLLWPVAFGAAA